MAVELANTCAAISGSNFSYPFQVDFDSGPKLIEGLHANWFPIVASSIVDQDTKPRN